MRLASYIFKLVSYGGVKVSTGFTMNRFARPGSAGLVKKRKNVTANTDTIDYAKMADLDNLAIAA